MIGVPPVAVVHLVRRQNGPEPLRRFMDSYRRHDAGVEHQLVIAMKGFRNEREREPFRALLETPHQVIDVPDRGYDVGAYWNIGDILEPVYACFLNSFSRILRAGWLLHLHRAAARVGVGLVGATGSHQSFRPTSLASYLRISRAIRHRIFVKEALLSIPFAHHVNYLRRKLLHGPDFDQFPNYHVRTTGFMLRRELMRQIRRVAIRRKLDAYRFESGRDGLTKQVIQMGLAPLVIGADGAAYVREDWHASNTFWQSRQENLLVADKQTEYYENGSDDLRQILAYVAWGEHARPATKVSGDRQGRA